MSGQHRDEGVITPSIPNGSGAAAILAAGLGVFVFAIVAFAGDKSAAIKSSLNFYRPTGPLSGVVAISLSLWILTWALLELRWRSKSVAIRGICIASLVMLVVGILLTFPPVVDLL